MDDDESEVIKCLELFGWSWVGQALTITTNLEYIESGERWFKYSDGHQVTTLGTAVIAKLVNSYFDFTRISPIFNVYSSMSYLGWLEMDDVCCLPFPFVIGLCGISPQRISAYFLTTDS